MRQMPHFLYLTLYSLKNESSFLASIASISSIISWLKSLALLIGLEILLFSNDHSPKSISWQRFEQNGRASLIAGAPHVGQGLASVTFFLIFLTSEVVKSYMTSLMRGCRLVDNIRHRRLIIIKTNVYLKRSI